MITHAIHRSYTYRSRLICIVASVLLSACAGDMQDLQAFVDATKNKYPGSVAPLPQFEPYKNHNYDAFEFRDPFEEKKEQKVEVNPNATGPQPDTDRRKEPLEFYPMDALKMVGTLEQEGESWGLIQDPKGTIHRVKPGNHAGENYGEITRIDEDKVVFLEILPDGLGAWIEREVTMSMGEK